MLNGVLFEDKTPLIKDVYDNPGQPLEKLRDINYQSIMKTVIRDLI